MAKSWASHTFILGLLIGAGVSALWVDAPLAAWCLKGNMPKALTKAFELAEVFGHGFGVSIILLTVAILDVSRRWTLPRLVMASLGAGLIANIGKLFVARLRPHHADLAQGVADSFLSFGTFAWRRSYEQGCPSSHTATAVGLAVGLAWLYPRGRWLFAALAGCVALQRIEAGAHFLSDTLWGAAVGYAVGWFAVSVPSLGYLGNKLERWLKRRCLAEGVVHASPSRSSARSCSIASSMSGASAPGTRP